jgi:hypothetical protein
MHVESVEARRLMAASVVGVTLSGDPLVPPDGQPILRASLTRSGSLYIDGSSGADRITLREIRGHIMIETRTTQDGQYVHLQSGLLAYSAQEVKRIFVDGRSGRDIVDVQFFSSTPVSLQDDAKDTLLRQSAIFTPVSTLSRSFYTAQGKVSFYLSDGTGSDNVVNFIGYGSFRSNQLDFVRPT